jgi:hypothetical protein
MHVDPLLMTVFDELLPITEPAIFNPDAERIKLQEQANLLSDLDRERDEFGDSFFDENEETAQLRESLEALGELCCIRSTASCILMM